jgi:hypothetical protein
MYSDMLGVVAEESSSFMEKHGILNSPNNGRDVLLLLLVARWSVGIRGCRAHSRAALASASQAHAATAE